MNSYRIFIGMFSAFIGLTQIGCGEGMYTGPVYPVKGRVLLANGKPLTGGAIQFIPAPGGLLASGPIGPDGTFTLVSLDRRDGAAPGAYKVRIEPSLEMTAPKGKKPRTLPFAEKIAPRMVKPD